MAGYVRIGDIRGESKEKKQKKWFNLTTVYQPVVRPPQPRYTRRKDPVTPETIPPIVRKFTPPVIKPPPLPKVRIPVLFRSKFIPLFSLMMPIHAGNQTCEGWFEFTDASGRTLCSHQFKGGKIIRVAMVPSESGGSGAPEVEVGLTAEEWNLRQGPSPDGPAALRAHAEA